MWEVALKQQKLSQAAVQLVCIGTDLVRAVLLRPQLVFEQPRGVLPKGAARLTLAAVSIMGVL